MARSGIGQDSSASGVFILSQAVEDLGEGVLADAVVAALVVVPRRRIRS